MAASARIGDRRERARHQRDHAEDRFADGQRRVAALEVAALVLGDLHVEERRRQLPIALADVARRLADRFRPPHPASVRSARISSSADARPSGDQSGSRWSWSWTPVKVAFTGRRR